MDVIDGGSGDDQLFGGNDADTITGAAGNDKIEGGFGNDLLNGQADNDRLFGGAGSDTLIGDHGTDRAWGGSGGDLLEGGAGKDQLWGDDGEDTLAGGLGDDLLTGGLDADVFVFEDRMRADTVTDFEDGIDLLDISGLGITDFAALTIVQMGSDVQIQFSTRDLLTLQGMDASDLGADDFIFADPLLMI